MPGINGELDEQPARSSAVGSSVSGGEEEGVRSGNVQRRMIDMATKSMRRW